MSKAPYVSAGAGRRVHGDALHRVHGLNRHWRFKEGWSPVWSQTSVSSGDVGLPHSWNARDSFQEGVRYEQGINRYERLFELPAGSRHSDGVWRLVSEGFYGYADIRLNGKNIWTGDGQYLGFKVPVEDVLEMDGVNQIRIRADNRYRADRLPGIRMPDFLLFGGLSGRLYLERRSRVRMEYDDLALLQNHLPDGSVDVRVQAKLMNDSEADVQVVAQYELLSPAGQSVGQVSTPRIRVRSGAHAFSDQAALCVPTPELWHTERPALYTLVCRVLQDGAVCEEWSTRIGLRKAEFVPDKGFFLNGERLPLCGWNRHESMPGFGRALHPGIHRLDAELLKNAGGNLVRLSHYPQHPEFLDACDELGILVFAEVASWKSVKGGRWLRAAEKQMRGMIARDRLHPSVILWGMGNESRSQEAFASFQEIIGELDPQRPSIYAENHLYRGRREDTLDVPDVLGVNYEISELDAAVAESRNRVVLVSECSNNPEAVRGNVEEEIRQVTMIRDDVLEINRHPAASGYTLWCMNDYATLRKERYMRYSGLVDAWRIPKPAYGLFKALNTSDPFLQVTGGRMQAGQADRVHILSNAEIVQVQDAEGAHTVPVENGYASCGVIPGQEGVLVTLTGHETQPPCQLQDYGRAEAIHLEPGCSDISLPSDLAAVDFRVMDNAGRPVRDWDGDILVDLCGPGEVCYFTRSPTVRICGGTGRVFVRATGEGGTVSVRAESGYLVSDALELSLGNSSAGEL